VGDVLASLVGEKLTTNVSFAELKEIKQRTLLQHKLVMVSHEMGHNVQLDGEYAKRIIAGESITGYYLYKDTFEFKPCCKVLMATNNLPFVKSIDNSMRRRIILIIFKREK